MEASDSSSAPWAEPEVQSPGDTAVVPSTDPFAERPEIYVGAAFAGGLVVAGLLRWIGR